MAELRAEEKTLRVLRFLMGTCHPGVCAALLPVGFTDDEMWRGWALVERITGRVDRVSTPELASALVAARGSAAEAEMWSWYQRWAQVACATITDPALLRALGVVVVVKARGTRRAVAKRARN